MLPLYRRDAVALLDAYRTGQHSPVEVCAETLERVSRFQPQLNAYSFLNESAMSEAAASERRWRDGKPIGALDGIPVVIKDNLSMQGLPASWGNAELATRIRDEDELPVARLQQAGAIVVGKANTPEFAVEGYTANAHFGVSGNPFDTRVTPGGSSGAVAAAVASGQATLGLGTDGGGSIRRPAAYCALVGLKPGLGTVPRANGLPQVLLDFEVVGPMTRSVRDARLMLSVLSGADRLDPVSRREPASDQRHRWRVLYVPRLGDAPCDPEILSIASRFMDTLSAVGCEVVEGELPLSLEAMTEHWKIISEVGMACLFDADPPLAASASEKYQAMAQRGRDASGVQLMNILNTITALRRQASVLFDQWDLVVTPATAAMPWPAADACPPTIDGQGVGPRGHAIYSGWVNAIGHPSVAIPAAMSSSGLPVGVQLVGDLGAEQRLLDLAERIEARSPGSQWPDAFA